MPSPPTLFDDEGDDHERNRGHGGEPAGRPASDHDTRDTSGDTGRGASPETEPGGDDAQPRRRAGRTAQRRRRAIAVRHPNYLFRRTVAIGGVVAVFAAAGLVAANLVGTGADTSTDGSARVEWNRVVTVDERTGVLVVADGDGDGEIARRRSGLRDITDVAVVDDTAVISTDGVATVIDLAASDDADPEPVTVGADGITRPSGSALTMLVPATSTSRGLIVHGSSGDQLDTDAFAPVAGARYEFGAARSDPSGRHVLVTDSGNFQSVLFSFDRDEPSFFPGLALAVDGNSVVTAQNVGNEATVSVFDHAGELLGSARTPSVRAAVLTGDTVRLVTVGGRIVELDIGTGDTGDGEQLEIGTVTEGHVGTAGDRLVVVGSDGTAIIADDGGVVGSYDGLVPRETTTPAAPLGTRCLSLGGSDGETARGELVVIDAASGDIVAEARASGTIHPSADGCTVVTSAAGGIEVLDADGVRRIDVAGTLVAVAPDAASIVVERNGRLVLTPLPDSTDTEDDSGGAIDSDDTDTDDTDTDTDDTDDVGVDIGPTGRLVAFTEL